MMTITEPLITASAYQDLTGTIGEVAPILDNWRRQGLLSGVKTVAEHGNGRYTVRAYLVRQPERPVLPAAPVVPRPYRWAGLDYLYLGTWLLRVFIAVGMIAGIVMFAIWVYTWFYALLAVAFGVTLAMIISSLVTTVATVGCAGVVVHCAGCRG